MSVSVKTIDYLTKLRMEKASELLQCTDMTVKEIVQAVGYIDENSFRRKIKSYYGVSIAEMRNIKTTVIQ